MKTSEKINMLSKYSSPSFFAYKDREYPEYTSLIDFKFKRVGGGRELIYAKWNHEYISNLSSDRIVKIIEFIKFNNAILKAYQNRSILSFLREVSC